MIPNTAKTWQAVEALPPQPGQEPDAQACLAAYPALERAKSTAQDPVHHAEGDVWTHTMMVLRALVQSADYAQSTPAERQVLFLAALLHDVAKADTTVIDPVTGRISQPGHSRRGAVDARVLLWRQGAPFALRESVCRLIAVHQWPFFALQRDATVQTLRRLSWELDVRLLCALAEADIRGRIAPDTQRVLDDIELLRELAREEGCLGQPRAFVDAHTRMEHARHGKGHPDYALYPAQGSAVTVLCGLPASGKDYWVAQHCTGLPVVSFDDARTELGLRYGENDGAAAHRAVDKAKALLRARTPFVWNATHLSCQMRDKTLDLLYRYDAQVRVVYLEQTFDVLRQRNQARDSTLTQAALERMFKRWEVPAPWEAQQVDYGVTGEWQ